MGEHREQISFGEGKRQAARIDVSRMLVSGMPGLCVGIACGYFRLAYLLSVLNLQQRRINKTSSVCTEYTLLKQLAYCSFVLMQASMHCVDGDILALALRTDRVCKCDVTGEHQQ